MKLRLAAIAIFTGLLYGCSTDFDVIAPYEEVMVVDGLLNHLDSLQTVRISKAFLGEGNALVMAQQSDSINYADVLDVNMEGIFQNQVVESFRLQRNEITNPPKDSGIFAYPFHISYTTNHVINKNNEYRITVTNRETGVVATSQTRIVKDMLVQSPFPAPSPFGDSLDWATAGAAPTNVIFIPGENSRMFDMIIRFHYREIDPAGNSVEKSIDWNFPDQTSANTINEIRYTFYKYDFFKFVGSNLDNKPGYIRRIDSLSNGIRPIELRLIAGSEDLKTYYQLQQPTAGIVQDRPLFTTVNNGLGLFTSRIIHSNFYFPKRVMEEAFDTSVSTINKNFRFD